MSDKRGPLASLTAQDGMVPNVANKTEFMIKLRRLENWDHLSVHDLSHNGVRELGSSPFLQKFQQRLKRKRYIDNAMGKYDVRAVLRSLRCCRPPDFRCSKHFSSTVSLPPFKSVIPLPMETNMSELDRVTDSELSHYYYLLLSLQFLSKINYEDNESQVRALPLEFLAVRSIANAVECAL